MTASARLATCEPLLLGIERERALAIVARIADRLRWLPPEQLNGSLADGAAGLSVMYATLARTAGSQRDADTAERYLALASARGVPRTRAGPGHYASGPGHYASGPGHYASGPGHYASGPGHYASGLGLHRGMAGIGWAEEHVSRLLDASQPSHDDLDELLLEMLERERPIGRTLSGGLAGIGVYARERGAAGTRLMEAVLARLADAVAADRSCSLPGSIADQADVVAFLALAVRDGHPSAIRALAGATGVLLALLERGRAAGAQATVALALAGPTFPHPAIARALEASVQSVSGAPIGGAAAEPTITCRRLHRIAVLTGAEAAWTAAQRAAVALLGAAERDRDQAAPGLLGGSAGMALVLWETATGYPSGWDRVLLLS
jgi:hypothetical protein